MEDINQSPLKVGYYSKSKADKKILADAAFGYYISKEIGRDDAAQTVVVKNNSIMAVESYEGRFDTIGRGCHYAGKNAVIVISGKRSKSDDNLLPVINAALLKYAVESGCRAVALESDKVIVSDLQECKDYADKSRLVFFAFEGTEILKYLKKGH